MFSFVGAFLVKYFSGCTTSNGIWHRGFDTVWNTLAEDFFLLQKLFIMIFDIWNYIIPSDKLMQKIWWCSCAATQDKGSGVGNSRRLPKRPPRQIFPISNPHSIQDDFFQFFCCKFLWSSFPAWLRQSDGELGQFLHKCELTSFFISNKQFPSGEEKYVDSRKNFPSHLVRRKSDFKGKFHPFAPS